MADLDALLHGRDPAWPEIQRWLSASPRTVEVLPSDRKQGEHNLLYLHASIESALGAVALETGGILLDHGWLRLVGSGSQRLPGDFISWNTSREDHQAFDGGIIVAFDAVGGFFAINVGAFPGELGDIFYLAPATLRWQDLSMTYSHFFYWAAHGDLPGFYPDVRWPGWEDEVAPLTGDHGISFYPPLWADKSAPVHERSRRAVPILELWNLQRDIARQIADLPDSSSIRIIVEE